ncbi:MAG: DUF4350 domain-containing protein [Woeseiaceae bacterium]|nr:DUF4350 domain-containing protein [Woeseiaceae bacterium]
MRQTTVVLLGILAAVLIATWFFSTHEKVTREEYVGYSGHARYNDFLAAEMLLTELGYEASSRSSFTPEAWLPDTTDTIVSRVSTSFSVPGQRETLQWWVNNGGHLVLFPSPEDADVNDEFLELFGYRLYAPDYDFDDDGSSDRELEYETLEADYSIDLAYAYYRIESLEGVENTATLTDRWGTIAVRRQYGDGIVTVIARSSFFENDFLESQDHARFFLDTVAGHIKPGQVWFIYAAAFPALWKLIWDSAPYAVFAGLALLLAALWAVIPAAGPKIRPQPAVRRSIVEHIRAAGRFVWRQRGAGDLGDSAVTALVHDAERRHPGIGRLPRQQQARVIAKITGRDPEAVFDVMNQAGDHRHRFFTQQMATLQSIRNDL